MKKGLLLAMAVALGFSGFAQKAEVSSELKNKSVKAVFNSGINDEVINLRSGGNTTVNAKFEATETQIGKTKYDLQSNSVLGERTYMTESGEIAATWTIGLDDPDFGDRGTGYNYFDGTSWGAIPTERVEEARTGWPSIAMYGDGEVLTSHGMYEGSYTDLGLMTRPTRGTGDWTLVNKPSTVGDIEYVWNRIATSGDNNDIIHVISNSYNEVNGQAKALVYNRTSDGGNTWEAEDVILEGTGAEFYNEISADDYKIVAKGNTVVILLTSPWYDLFFLKSEDNGETWEKNVVWEHPYPNFDWETTITTDTIWSPDGSLDADIDSEGNVHLAFGLTRVVHTEAGTSYNYFPYTDGIVYWNESMDKFENPSNQHYALKYENIPAVCNAGFVPDLNGNNQLDLEEELQVYPTIGMSTQPALHIDNDDNIFLMWTAQNEELTATGETPKNHRHIFGRARAFGEWLDVIHITPGFMHNWEDCVFPDIMGTKDNKVHYFFQADGQPGLALRDDHPHTDNNITYGVLDYNEFALNIGVDNTFEAAMTVSQNFPNPANNTTNIDITVANNSNVSVEVINMVGQTVFSAVENVTAGTSTIQLNVADYAKGVYFYTVTAGTEKVTKKMIVE
jgi:hypothetical protein